MKALGGKLKIIADSGDESYVLGQPGSETLPGVGSYRFNPNVGRHDV